MALLRRKPLTRECFGGSRSVFFFLFQVQSIFAFVPSHRQRYLRFHPLSLSTQPSQDEEAALQWDLFRKHHARGSWKGIWTSYDYLGDVIDETIASVDLDYDADQDIIAQTHRMVVGAKVSDCETCFDSFETRDIPVAKYSPGSLHKSRLASVGMVNGPSLLRSGVMATELVLAYGDGRVRVVFQHAPVWEQGVEPSTGPPQGLKLYRTLLSKEALRDAPPSADTEARRPPPAGNPRFSRPVPPFDWQQKWSGTSWTWGPSTGDRGWQLDEMEEVDAWHGRPTGDSPNVWSLRLGSILVHCPRVVMSDEVGLCRIAWLPEEDTPENPAKLLRLEAGVLALRPMAEEETEDEVVAFHPPFLASLRCDVVTSVGELETRPPPLLDEETKVISQTGNDGDSSGVDDELRNALNL